MKPYVCTLHVTGYATVTVMADSEDDAARKAEEIDPWELAEEIEPCELEVEVTDATCDDVESDEEAA